MPLYTQLLALQWMGVGGGLGRVGKGGGTQVVLYLCGEDGMRYFCENPGFNQSRGGGGGGGGMG